MELTCPKCHGAMRQYERNGVNVDQCADCRGIFLDRGELERLVNAETAFASRAEPAQAPPAPQYSAQPYAAPQHHSSQHHSSQQYGQPQYGGGYRPKKKKSFFEELFD